MADPEAALRRFTEELGGLAALHPDIAQAAAERRLAQYQAISLRAPVFVWNAMGEGRPAGVQALRRFREAEDAVWNAEGVLRAVASGSLTRTQAEVFRDAYPEMHAVLIKSILDGREAVAKLPRERRAVVELLLGQALSTRTPEYAARQQMTFAPPPAAAPNPASGSISPPAPTPAQAAFAPGNH
jgi:hypothetical protein